MNVLHVWDSEYPWDVRAEKVSRCLTDAGHAVHMVARNRRADPTEERLDEAVVHRLAPWRWAGSRVDAACQFPAFFNPRWSGLIRRTARRIDADVIVVRDLPLAPTAIRVGRRLGVPVVLDMAENYPAMIRAIYEHGRQRPLDHLVRNPAAVQAIERWVLARIDHVVVVVEESGERLEALGLAPDAITVARNTPPRSRVESIPKKDLDSEPSGNGRPLRLVYLGLMEAPRGLEVVIDGLAELASDGAEVSLDLIGNGRDLELFRARVGRLDLTDRVVFHGFRPYEEALRTVADADVGLVPHIANESWNTTIPNKLFDYMAAGLPVITSDARPAARIVRETGAGAVYESRDPADFASAVSALRDAGSRRKAGASGQRAVREEYNWENDGARLVEAVERLVGSR